MKSFTHVHHRSGNYYRIIARGHDVTNGHDPIPVVIYQDATGEFYVRAAAEFDDGRFEELKEDA